MASPGATETWLYMTGYTGSLYDWDTFIGGVAGQHDDSDATRFVAKSSLGGNFTSFIIPDTPSMSDGAVIDQVGMWVRPEYGKIYVRWLITSTTTGSSTKSQYNYNGAGIWFLEWTEFDTGVPWTAAHFNSNDLRVQSRPGTTTMWLCEWKPVVYWFPPAGGFVSFFGCLGPLVAIGLEHMPSIAKEIFKRTGTRMNSLSYARALREFKEYRQPKHFILGVAA